MITKVHKATGVHMQCVTLMRAYAYFCLRSAVCDLVLAEIVLRVQGLLHHHTVTHQRAIGNGGQTSVIEGGDLEQDQRGEQQGQVRFMVAGKIASACRQNRPALASHAWRLTMDTACGLSSGIAEQKRFANSAKHCSWTSCVVAAISENMPSSTERGETMWWSMSCCCCWVRSLTPLSAARGTAEGVTSIV